MLLVKLLSKLQEFFRVGLGGIRLTKYSYIGIANFMDASKIIYIRKYIQINTHNKNGNKQTSAKFNQLPFYCYLLIFLH